MKRDYYEILNVQRSATESEIKKSFRKLAQTCHPDKNQGASAAEEEFKELNEAYEVLMDPEKRAAYDRFGHDGPRQGDGFNPFQHFSGAGFNPFADFFNGDMFGSRGSRGDGQGRQRGEDLQCVVELSLEEVYAGCEKEIQYTRHIKCESCKGTGGEGGASPSRCGGCGGNGKVSIIHGPFHVTQPCHVCGGAGQFIQVPCKVCKGDGRTTGSHTVRITVPISIDDGTQLRVAGSGSFGKRNGSTGDLICIVRVREHEHLRRDGINLFCKIDIPFVTATLGGSVPVQGIRETCYVNVPPGTQSEAILCVPGKGLRSPTKSGDINVQIRVIVPQSLTEEQKQSLLVFANLTPC